MDILYRLLGIDVPAAATAHSLELQLRGPLSWWLATLLALFLCALVFFLYVTENGKVSWVMRTLMTLCRAAALVFLVALICRPVLQAEFEATRLRDIVLLVDNSESMKQHDRRVTLADKLRVAIAQGKLLPGTPLAGQDAPYQVPAGTLVDPPREELVRQVLNNGELHLLADLQKFGPVVPMLFGLDARPVVTEAAHDPKKPLTAKQVLEDFHADQQQTGLADAIHGLLQRKGGDLPAAIVVMSDGRDNASKYMLDEVAQECAQLKVPLHVYGTGAGEAGSLKLRDLFVQETLFADDNVTVPVHWRADGLEKGTAVITVALGNKQERKEVPIQKGTDQVTEFTFTVPKVKDKVSRTDISAGILLREDDSFKDELRRPVQIIDGKVKALYVEYSPRKEYHFLQTAMLRDRRIEPRFWLITSDPKALSGGPFERDFPNKKDLAQYDVVLLGDVPADKLTKQNREALAEFVSKNRGGLVVLAGRQHMPAAYAGSAEFTSLLPVEFQAHKFAVDSPGNPLAFRPQLTVAGLRTDWLALSDLPDENRKVWKELPGLFWYYPVTKLRPGAVPLLNHPTAKMGDEPMPLAAAHYFGKGQVVFVGFEETWRWRLNTQDKVFGRYWGQLLLQMALPHKLGASASRVELSLNRSAMVVGKPGTLFARLLDRNYEPLKSAQIEGAAEYLDAKPGQENSFKLVLEPVPGREKDGEFRGVLPNHLPGRWQVKLADPVPTLFPFTVSLPPLHELEDAPMAAEALRTVASLSGGRFYQEETLDQLAGSIRPRETRYTLHQEVLLWGPVAYLIFAGLVACEWLLRKFANLS
jgi:hypothetical protein